MDKHKIVIFCQGQDVEHNQQADNLCIHAKKPAVFIHDTCAFDLHISNPSNIYTHKHTSYV